MTWEEALQLIEAQQAQQDREREEARAQVTPHVRRPLDRSKLSRHAGASPHNRVPLGAGSATYCGAPLTTEDWDRRGALARKNQELVASSGVCSDCLARATEEGSR